LSNSKTLLQYLYSDKVEEKKELIKGITLGNKDKFQLTPLPQVLPTHVATATHCHAISDILTQHICPIFQDEVLVLWGEHDQIFPVEKAFEVARSVHADLTCTF
jgi:hypothetical protein